MHTLDSNQSFLNEVAKACDFCMKPWVHSVVDKSTEPRLVFEEENIDLTLRVECRNQDGHRSPENDLEIEIFRSGSDLSITLCWVFFPDKPILWHCRHSIWMDSEKGTRLSPPEGASSLETLARRLRACFLVEEY